jgi:hypothetical protein
VPCGHPLYAHSHLRCSHWTTNAYLSLHYIAIIQYCKNTVAIQHVDKEWKLEKN